MCRITPIDPERDEVSPDVRLFFRQDERSFGTVLNPSRILAYRPPILGAARALGLSVAKDARLPDGLRALVCVRVATLVGCPF